MNDKGSYKFTKLTKEDSDYLKESHDEHLLAFWPENDIFSKILSISENVTIMETPTEKALSEVEKAQADVDRYEAKLAEQERELEKTKFYLTICKRSLKAHLKAEEKFKK